MHPKVTGANQLGLNVSLAHGSKQCAPLNQFRGVEAPCPLQLSVNDDELWREIYRLFLRLRRPNRSACSTVSGRACPSVSGRKMYSRPDMVDRTPNTRDGSGFQTNACAENRTGAWFTQYLKNCPEKLLKIVRSDSDEDHTRALNAAWHQWPAEGVETTSWSPSSNTATHHREWPQTSEPGAVVGPAQSLWL